MSQTGSSGNYHSYESYASSVEDYDKHTASTGEKYRELNRRNVSSPQPIRTIVDKQQTMNSMFGFKPFADISKQEVKLDEIGDSKVDEVVGQVGNILWVICCGWWIALTYAIIGVIFHLTFIGRSYGKSSFALASYYLWPFQKFVLITNSADSERLLDNKPINDDIDTSCDLPFLLWFLLACPVLSTVHCLSWAICWFFVFSIPMAKVNGVGLQIIVRKDIKHLEISNEMKAGSKVLLYAAQAINRHYGAYTIQGMNVILLNMLPFVFLSLFLSYIPYLLGDPFDPILIFALCAISVIPLSYFLGFALSSLSAQTSFGIGAILNATFGSLIELILYFFAISAGSLNSLVQAGITGTLLAMMLLLPGLSMIFGGIKHKEQKFNPTAAGVSGILLLLSVVGAFTPTIYYQAYGHFILQCSDCSSSLPHSSNSTYSCNECTWTQGLLDNDETYTHGAKPLMYVCAAILPVSYIVGLIFTLKTHAHLLDNSEYENHEEHGPSPLWSKTKCIVMLLIGITLFSLVAEAMVTSLEPTIDSLGISQTFAGFTVFALIPSVAELVNAIQFSLNNNFSMSLEIGNSAAIQVSLIQMPILILFGAIISPNNANAAFTLIFPVLDLFAVMISVIIVNYISIDGKANYFLGSSLVICYVLIAAAFFYVPDAVE